MHLTIPGRQLLAASFSGGMRQLRQLVRFGVVGLFNTGLAYGIYFLFIRLGAVFWLANIISLVFGICVGFVTQGSLVFFNRDKRRFGRFVITWLSIYLVQTWCIGLLIAHGKDAAIAGIIVLPGTVIASYLAQKFFVFGVREREAHPKS